MENKKESSMIRLTGLWENQDKNGRTYLTGYLGDTKVHIFRNEFKKGDKHPDHIVYLSPKTFKKDDSQELNDLSRDPEETPF